MVVVDDFFKGPDTHGGAAQFFDALAFFLQIQQAK
jgi:hypothetical protein